MNLWEFAIRMELDGEQYYLKQAALHRDTPLQKVFYKLAQDELLHAEILKDRRLGKTQMEAALRETENVFSRLEDFKDDIKPRPGQLEAYQAGAQMERRSIELYEKMLQEGEPEDVLSF
jgi:rubrerythrin